MSDYVKRLRDARNWFDDGRCCGQLDSSGTCAAPACIFGEALKEFFLAADRIEAQAARIAELEEELSIWRSVFPDIAPERVLPHRRLLLNRIAELEAALRNLDDMIVDLDAGHIELHQASRFINTALAGGRDG